MNLRLVTLLFATVSAMITSCKHDDSAVPNRVYNGFRINDSVYKVRAIEIDTTGPGCRLRLHSDSVNIGTLEISAAFDAWPVADGNYQYIISREPKDSFVAICFKPGTQLTSRFCESAPAQLSGGLILNINGGRRWLSYSGTGEEGNHARRLLEIKYSEMFE